MSRNSHVSLGGASGQPVNGSSGSSFFNNTPSPIPMQISSSRRLSFDSSNRRSNGLAAEAGGDTNASASVTAGNGTANSSKYFGSSKLSSVARSLANRKGKPWANGNVDEGMRNETIDDFRSTTAAVASGFTPSSDARYLEQGGETPI
ncbi:cell division cycle protein 27 homolog B-like [Malus sylvestris]|uniref:cell division cycle protein 27 homolog B-like n=1 Tax=Malus sylvestris TaxID=3752 RepID=UPI0010AA86E4|nr:cell division cycle protein 27 homolog B-like isoform X1 [Malus domestica]XP_028950401.1 cell division cycle protein 27 homolog B-like isoform X1 [Malus domestica]XP_050128986.1 cell division cycle protein 27 homolog B-like [Malus sylvestris]XP_050128987.1 cell division cycle protein 27 homolog B-like [Malus sylvestris]XP_050128988.1 cell division cycle protein 27 homolog B-like [Malus sylvestris]XP_050128989.1 cell division cycle protein 27 homolog B-like [Malus sylvestris]XP_050128990.1 